MRKNDPARPFVTGDIVRLKSGGPLMTVERLLDFVDPIQVECQWFASKKLQNGRFPPAALDRVEQEARAHRRSKRS